MFVFLFARYAVVPSLLRLSDKGDHVSVTSINTTAHPFPRKSGNGILSIVSIHPREFALIAISKRDADRW